MQQPSSSSSSTEAWRVVVFTTIQDGLVYQMIEQILQPLGHQIVGVVTTPGPPARRSSDYLGVVNAVRPEVDVIVSTHPARLAAMLAPLRPDLIICCGFPYRLSPDVTTLPRLGAINMHPSLLPRHRGPWPLHWTFRAGDTEAGMTVHWMDSSFDTGRILAQERVPVTDDDDGTTLMMKLAPIAHELLVDALSRVAAGDRGDLQDESLATEAGLFEDAWRVVSWDQPARTVHNQVRSWTGITETPRGAFAILDGERVLVSRTRLGLDGAAGEHLPGTVVRRDEDSLVVQCSDGPIEILEWVPTT